MLRLEGQSIERERGIYKPTHAHAPLRRREEKEQGERERGTQGRSERENHDANTFMWTCIRIGLKRIGSSMGCAKDKAMNKKCVRVFTPPNSNSPVASK